MDGTFQQHGKLFGSAIATLAQGKQVLLLVEAPGAARTALAQFESGELRWVEGRMWHVIVYSEAVDRAIVDAVDALADVRFHLPHFGQLELRL